jgi:hypothetical protein
MITNDNEVYEGLSGGLLGNGRYWWGRSLGDNAEGSPGQVSFDHKVLFDREDAEGDVVGFYHTHPHCVGSPSTTDYATMGAWTLSFGRALVCLIEGTDGLNAHWFVDDETEHISGWVRKVGDIFVGKVPKNVQQHVSS